MNAFYFYEFLFFLEDDTAPILLLHRLVILDLHCFAQLQQKYLADLFSPFTLVINRLKLCQLLSELPHELSNIRVLEHDSLFVGFWLFLEIGLESKILVTDIGCFFRPILHLDYNVRVVIRAGFFLVNPSSLAPVLPSNEADGNSFLHFLVVRHDPKRNKMIPEATKGYRTIQAS